MGPGIVTSKMNKESTEMDLLVTLKRMIIL
jgi:hypothetical protein